MPRDFRVDLTVCSYITAYSYMPKVICRYGDVSVAPCSSVRLSTTYKETCMQPRKKTNVPAAPLTTSQMLGSLIKSARDIMRKDKGLNGDLDRLPLLTWIMFLKFLDDLAVCGKKSWLWLI
jgi:hypothetical protein